MLWAWLCALLRVQGPSEQGQNSAAQSGGSPGRAELTTQLGGAPLGAACSGLTVGLHALFWAPQALGERHRGGAEQERGGQVWGGWEVCVFLDSLGLSPVRDPVPPRESLLRPPVCWGPADPQLAGHRHPASWEESLPRGMAWGGTPSPIHPLSGGWAAEIGTPSGRVTLNLCCPLRPGFSLGAETVPGTQ